jgi:integrase
MAGHLVRPVWDRGLGESAVWGIVKAAAREAGIEGGLAPHDCRRTFAKLARKGGAALEQIQEALGHSSLTTTERYLGHELDLGKVAGDMIVIELDQRKRKEGKGEPNAG